MQSITKHIDKEAHAKQEVAKQAEKILKNQIAGMEDHHEQEKKL